MPVLLAEVQVLQVLPLLHGAASMDRSLEVVLAVIAGNSRAECYGYVPVSLGAFTDALQSTPRACKRSLIFLFGGNIDYNFTIFLIMFKITT